MLLIEIFLFWISLKKIKIYAATKNVDLIRELRITNCVLAIYMMICAIFGIISLIVYYQEAPELYNSFLVIMIIAMVLYAALAAAHTFLCVKMNIKQNVATNTVRYCPKCGTAVPLGTYCTRCGASLSDKENEEMNKL